MLETSEERVRLLKAGISGKEIEQLYIIYNKLKIVVKPVLFETAHHEENNNGRDKASAETGYS